MLQFKLPPKLQPSVFLNTMQNEFTPLTLTYEFHLEFLTEKEDRYTLRVPVNIEDNFPAREPIPPPPLPVEPTSEPMYDNTPISDNRGEFTEANQQFVPPASFEPPPPYQAQSWDEHETPPNYPIPAAVPHDDVNSGGLYPVLPGMKPYTPPADSFDFQNLPAYNPAFSNAQQTH